MSEEPRRGLVVRIELQRPLELCAPVRLLRLVLRRTCADDVCRIDVVLRPDLAICLQRTGLHGEQECESIIALYRALHAQNLPDLTGSRQSDGYDVVEALTDL